MKAEQSKCKIRRFLFQKSEKALEANFLFLVSRVRESKKDFFLNQTAREKKKIHYKFQESQKF